MYVQLPLVGFKKYFQIKSDVYNKNVFLPRYVKHTAKYLQYFLIVFFVKFLSSFRTKPTLM